LSSTNGTCGIDPRDWDSCRPVPGLMILWGDSVSIPGAATAPGYGPVPLRGRGDNSLATPRIVIREDPRGGNRPWLWASAPPGRGDNSLATPRIVIREVIPGPFLTDRSEVMKSLLARSDKHPVGRLA
jgi:hypothetical protein